jgi:hypothetical protein
VTRVDPHRVVRTTFALRPVVHAHVHPPGENVEQVRRLTGIGSRDGTQVLFPVPARFEPPLDDRLPAKRDDEPLALVNERSLVPRGVESGQRPLACGRCRIRTFLGMRRRNCRTSMPTH